MTDSALDSGSRLSPTRRVAFAVRHFELAEKRVLDVGCGGGESLRHFGPGSVGLELNDEYVRRARSRGLPIHQWNFVDGIPSPLRGRFDAVWCSNLLEHVLSPHLFLLDLRQALVAGGLLLIVVPVSRRLRVGPWGGFDAADHVSFFTPFTLRHTVARAGYDVRYLGCASVPGAPRTLSSLLAHVSPSVLLAASMVEDFQYPEKAHKQLVDGKPVFA